MIFIAKRIKQAKLDAHQILWIHDELEYEVANADVDRLIEITEQSFLDSGRYWKFRVPLVGEAKVGTNWKNCH
jgi:DNA polymerase I-like protein with 3'-5' exonuclease and polymerase domains